MFCNPTNKKMMLIWREKNSYPVEPLSFSMSLIVTIFSKNIKNFTATTQKTKHCEQLLKVVLRWIDNIMDESLL